MSDNKLLAENTIRRFMKLANVEGLTENFIEDLEERGMPVAKRAPAKRGKEKMEEEVEETNEEINEEEEVDLEENFGDLQEEEDDEEMEMAAELGAEDEMDADMDAEPEAGAADMSLSEEEARLLIDLGERLSAAMGGAEEAPADDMGDLDAEAPEAPEEDEEMMEEEFDQEDLVNEVLKRVTKRLVAEKLKNRK